MKQFRFTDDQIFDFLLQADTGMSVKELRRTSRINNPPFIKGALSLAKNQIN